MKLRPFALSIVMLTLGWALAGGSALAASKRTAQKDAAESQRAELRDKLKALKADIYKTEAAKDQASDALAASEQSISEANRSLRELQDEQNATQDKLNALLRQQAELNAKVEQQKLQLSNFLRQQYMHGSSDRLKLLLSGDDPNRINRDLQYMSYVSQTQAKMIDSLHASLQAVDKNTQDTQDAKSELDEIAQEQLQHKAELEKEKKVRAGVLNQLADKLHNQKKQADILQKNEQMLNALVNRLNILIEEQAKAERARAEQLEKQRQEKLAEEKARKLANDKKKPGPTEKREDIVVANNLPPPPPADNSDFGRMKGQLKLPLRGEIVAKFGTKRGDGPSWKGLFIRAAEGTEVHAIASGKVVFSEWLRGWGNMIIIDHGGLYLSLYGFNQAVLKHAGDNVQAGDVIASAGNSGGNEESGLYFELRHQGRAFDPLSWIPAR